MKSLSYSLWGLIVSSLFLNGCFLPGQDGDDFEPPPPPAAAQFIHQNPEMGTIEVLFNDGLITSVSFDRVSPAVTLPQGEGVFSFRNAGAPSTFYSTELYTLEDRVYTFALVPESFSDRAILDLSDAPPEAVEGQHWLRFLNLTDLEAGTIYQADTEIITLPFEDNLSAYNAVDSASEADISLVYELNRPYSVDSKISLPAGGASLVILNGQTDDSDSMNIRSVALDIERLSLVEPGAEVTEE